MASAWNPLASHDLERRDLDHVTHYTCRICQRDFRASRSGVAAWSVDPAGSPLEDRVNQRWLNEPCPGSPQRRDEYDRTRIK